MIQTEILLLVTVGCTIIHAENTESIPQNCTKIQSVYQMLSTTTVIYYSDRTCSRFLWWRKCNYEKRSRKETRNKKKLIYRTVMVCCEGYIEDSNGSCVKGCVTGMYGDRCQYNCSCPTNAMTGCEKTNGNCTCLPGKMEPNCEENCTAGRFGAGCEYHCLCENNSTCNPENGACNCTSPGYIGNHCETECEDGTYGRNCRGICDCLGSETCDHITGTCSCKAGRTGTNCTEHCSNITFGPNCVNSCTCNPNNTEYCNKTNGACVCLPGWKGDNCGYVCNDGFYGKDCDFLCNCSETQICEPKSGRCISNCICYAAGTENCKQDSPPCNCSLEMQTNACTEANTTILSQIKKFLTTICDCKPDDAFCIPQNDSCICKVGYNGDQCEKEVDQSTGNKFKDNLADEQTSSNSAVIGGAVAGILLVVIGVLTIVAFLIKRNKSSKPENVQEMQGKKKSNIFSNAAYATESINDVSTMQSRQENKILYENAGNKAPNSSNSKNGNDSNYTATADYHHIQFNLERPETAATSVYSHLMENTNESDTDGYVYDVTTKGHRKFDNDINGQYAIARTNKSATDDTYDSTQQARSLDSDDTYS